MKTLIQIGCNVGDDEVGRILSESKDRFRALLIDANKNSLEKCRSFYNKMINDHHIDFLEYAIVPNPDIDSVIIYVPKNDNVSPFVSTIENHSAAHSHSDCEAIIVPAITINKLFEIYNIKTLDYLYIDTEGLCVDILLELNMDMYKIQTIVFEFIHSDGMLSYGGEKLNNLQKKILSYNYNIQQSEYNLVCTKNAK